MKFPTLRIVAVMAVVILPAVWACSAYAATAPLTLPPEFRDLKTATTLPVLTCPITAPGWGLKEPGVHFNFPTAMDCKFRTATNPDALLAKIPDTELARLSLIYDIRQTEMASKAIPSMHAYAIRNVAPLLEVMAARMSAKSLLRVKANFGATDTDRAVAAKASFAVQSQYFAAPPPSPKAGSRAYAMLQGMRADAAMYAANPTLDLAVQEIFLEYFAVEGATIASALANTALFASGPLAKTFTAFYLLGTGIYQTGTWMYYTALPQVSITIGEIISPPAGGPGGVVTSECDHTHCKPR